MVCVMIPSIRTTAYLTALATALLGIASAAAGAVRSSAPARPAAPPRQVLDPLDKAGFHRPSPEVMAMLYTELRKKPGFEDAQIATVPVRYVQSGAAVFPVGAQFATFQGDVDGDKKLEWVIGCYVPTPEPTTARPLAGDERARVAVFRKDGTGKWNVWCSPGLGFEFAEPQCNVEEVVNGLDDLRNLILPLSLVDVDGDGRKEIAYHCRSQAASLGGLPGVYRWETNRWLSIAPQADRFSLQDLDGDGKLEVITGSRRIGHGTGDDDVPRVWRWKDRRYREASSDFPHFYADLTLRYQEYLRKREQSGEPIDRTIWERAIQKATLLAGRPAARRPGARLNGG